MKKIDIKKLLDDNKVEFELRLAELLKLKNEIKGKREDKKRLEDWLNILRGRFDSINSIYIQTPDDPIVVASSPNTEENKETDQNIQEK